MVAALDLDQMLTTAQAARRLDVTPAMVRVWLRSGKLSHVSSPYGALIDPQAVARLAEQRAVAAGARR